jgi:hypothetical protein
MQVRQILQALGQEEAMTVGIDGGAAFAVDDAFIIVVCWYSR